MIYLFIFLLVALPPLLVFSAKPETKLWLRVWRLLAAVLLGYILLNSALHWHRAEQWEAFEACQKENSPVPELEMSDKCSGYINIADGASNIFYLILGWVPVMGYVGIFEIIWRIKYHKDIRQLGKNYKGKWISKIVIGVSVFIFIIYPLCAIGSWLILKLMNYL